MGAKKQNGMILDRGATDAYPLGASAAVRAGYLEFCRRHPGFDDSALARRAGRPTKKKRVFHGT